MTINHTRRHKPSPLQVWKAQYTYLSQTIREMKQISRSPACRGVLGRKRTDRHVSRLAFMQEQARWHLACRGTAAAQARELWELNRIDEMVTFVETKATQP